MVHIGIDTVELKGQGFERIAEVGSQVRAGDEVVRVDLEVLKSNDKSIVTPVVITSPDKVKSIDVKFGTGGAEAAVLTLV